VSGEWRSPTWVTATVPGTTKQPNGKTHLSVMENFDQGTEAISLSMATKVVLDELATKDDGNIIIIIISTVAIVQVVGGGTIIAPP
jgi:hypothetical protein